MNIIAPNIKNGGGKELLEYLLEHLDQMYKEIMVTVYIDKSLSYIQNTKNRKVIVLESAFEKISLFMKKIDNALYFGNLPPLLKSKNSVVYFHNLYLLMNLKTLSASSLKFFIKYFLQQIYIKKFVSNVDIVACQNNFIKNKFVKKYNFQNVEILPFFRLCDKKKYDFKDKKYDFCYISLAHPHKNHFLLLDALELLSKKQIKVRIALTIESDKQDLIDKITKINSYGVVKIDNLGVLSKDCVCKVYSESKCLVFPSTEETFGLGLIEATYMNLDVIAADLKYVYQAVEPSMVFNPYSARMCADIMEKYLKGTSKESVPLVKNNIDKLINKVCNYVQK